MATRFLCPTCNKETLLLRETCDLPSTQRSDEMQIQTLACTACGFHACGIYEEAHRGAIDDDSVDHRCYPLDEMSFHELETLIHAANTEHAPGQKAAIDALVKLATEQGTHPNIMVEWEEPLVLKL